MAKKKAAPADEVEELEELEAAEETDEAPAKKKSSQPEVTFGVADLAKHLSKELGKEITPRDLRAQIRRMAREDNARVQREIVPGNRTRYDWPKGLKDPEVKAIIKAVKDGEIEAGKKEALDKLKETKAKKKAEKDAAGKKGKGKGKGKGKSKAADDEVEDIDLDED